jgi:hypothetical protein
VGDETGSDSGSRDHGRRLTVWQLAVPSVPAEKTKVGVFLGRSISPQLTRQPQLMIGRSFTSITDECERETRQPKLVSSSSDPQLQISRPSRRSES